MKPVVYILLALVAMGLIGSHYGVPGAGWCIFVGLAGLVFGDVLA